MNLLKPKEWILERQESIMEYYLGQKITPKLIRSPFREDKHPTCGFYYGKTGRLYLHDFATDEHFDCIEIVKRLYGISYNKAIQRINIDADKFETQDKAEINEHKLLEYIVGNEDYTYFNKLGIKDSTLKRYGVYSARAVYLNEELTWKATAKNPIFIYQYPSGRFKAYRPLEKEREKKWISNSTIHDVQGYLQLPTTGKIAIITSSMKDVMLLKELGFAAIAFSSEGIPTKGENKKFVEEVIEQLKERFSLVLLFLDNDKPGIEYANKIGKAYNIKSICIPNDQPKDVSDYAAKYGIKKTKKMVKKLISKAAIYEQKDFLEFVSDLNASNTYTSVDVPRDLFDLPGIEIVM